MSARYRARAGRSEPFRPRNGAAALRRRNYIAAAKNLGRFAAIRSWHALRGGSGLALKAARNPRIALAVLNERLRAAQPPGPESCEPEAVQLAYRRLVGLRRRVAKDRAGPGNAALIRQGGRPRLAYISPLPPDRTGVADYSAALLPELARHYEITTIGPSAARRGGRDYAWFRRNAHTFDRVLYQFGNSPFHEEMVRLLEAVPGTVALHDVFLSDLGAYLQSRPDWRGWWPRELYASHGYGALQAFHAGEPGASLTLRFASSGFILRQADGVLVHSQHARELLERFYGPVEPGRVAIAPFVPGEPPRFSRSEARAALGVPEDAFLICSFGSVAPAKLSDRLVEGWTRSRAARQGARLTLVGGGAPAFVQQTQALARKAGLDPQLIVTGYADPELYGRYLAAADLALQLRANSRGETSGAVFDALTQGVPTIVNRHGSFDELPDTAVLKIPDVVHPEALAEAIDALWADEARRRSLGVAGAEHAAKAATAARAADAYAEHIERFAAQPSTLAELTATARTLGDGPQAALEAARRVSPTEPRQGPPTLFVDVSALAMEDLGTGVQRVVRAQLLGLLKSPPPGYRVEPARIRTCNGTVQLAYARSYAARLLGLQRYRLQDAPITFRAGDIFYMADLSAGAVALAAEGGLFERMRRAGVRIGVLVHDLLPLQLPDCFPPGAAEDHLRWLQGVCDAADLLIGVSAAVAQDVRDWLAVNPIASRPTPQVSHLHHGADISASSPTVGLPSAAARVFAALEQRPTFLMLGTVEPRKAYAQALDAFERLWATGTDVNLVIVGAEGWKGLPNEARRDIPQVVERLRGHPEANRRLFWLSKASDQYLKMVMARSTCLLAASYGEGFGLPLIEAGAEGLPILARDIPVFREVAGAHAAYFTGHSPETLAAAISAWLNDYHAGRRPRTSALPSLTWAENVARLKTLLGLPSE